MRNLPSFVICFFCLFSSLFAATEALYLTLPKDPTSSMSIHWLDFVQTDKKDQLLYKRADSEIWQKASFSDRMFGKSSCFINTCLLSGLDPDTEYCFRLAKEQKIYRFRTIPVELARPLKIVVGGDFCLSDSLYHKMNQAVAKTEPDFIILGGDLAYAYRKGLFVGKKDSISRWISFLKEWSVTLVGKEDRLIPFTAVIGNHDVSSLERKKQNMDALFFQLFPPIDNLSYRTLDIANKLSFVLLDTGHISPIEGTQSNWLKTSLEERKQVPWKLAIYHIGAYPSIYNFAEKVPALIRAHFVPSFEDLGVQLAFENHNHAFKKTYPLLKGKIDPSGVVYLGDGSWGVPPRRTGGNRWYLEKKDALNTFSLLTLEKELLKVETFDNKSNLVDTWESRMSKP